MQKTIQQKPITSKEVSGISSPITAWAVEVDGYMDASRIFPTRSLARFIRNRILENDPVIMKATTRKVVLQVVPGR